MRILASLWHTLVKRYLSFSAYLDPNNIQSKWKITQYFLSIDSYTLLLFISKKIMFTNNLILPFSLHYFCITSQLLQHLIPFQIFEHRLLHNYSNKLAVLRALPTESKQLHVA